MSRDATFRFCFVLFCTSSFVGGKGTDFNDTIVVKASGGQTLTMVYIYYGMPAGDVLVGILITQPITHPPSQFRPSTEIDR